MGCQDVDCVIDFNVAVPLEQRQVIGQAGLAALLAIARCDGDPSHRALAAIRGVRDHLLRIDVALESLPLITPQMLP